MDSGEGESGIRARIEQGDAFLNADDFERAAELYREAIQLIPAPAHEHEVSLEAFTALGEACFFAGHFTQALHCFRMALKSPNGTANPLVHLRLGQTRFEIGDFHHAAESLLYAYALEGRDLFRGEDDKYFSYLSKFLDR